MKKTVSIILISALLVSIGTVSVFGDTVIKTGNIITLSSNYFYNSSGTPELRIIIEGNYSDPYLMNYAETNNNHWVYTIEQDYFFRIRLLNSNTTLYANLRTPNLTFTAQCPAFSSNNQYVSFDSTTVLDFTLGDITNAYLNNIGQFALSYNNRNIYIAPASTINMFVSFKRITTVTVNSSSYAFSVSDWDSPLSSITYDNTVVPTQVAEGYSSDNSYLLRNLVSNTNELIDLIETQISNDSTHSSNQISWLRGIVERETINNNYLNSIDSNIQSILNAYTSNSQNAQSVTSSTQTNDQTISNIATNEDTWFTQNDQALQATGINNFNYTPTVMSGMSVISDQFTQLWLAVGDWNFVYTFSMMLGLVVLILRHNPQRKKSSSSSSGGGKSNAASS